jgi:hypothetical protein
MNKGRVGEERGSKEMDRCPLTTNFIDSQSVLLSSNAWRPLFLKTKELIVSL